MNTNVLILTCSSKHSGYCVAGIVAETGKWIRLVGSKNISCNEIPKNYMQYAPFERCKPLDLVCVDVTEYVPEKIQPENALVNLSQPPVFIREVKTYELMPFVANDKYIYNSTVSYMKREAAIRCGFSLRLYNVKNVCLHSFEYEGRPKSRVCFDYNGVHYDEWSMTDPAFYGCASGMICEDALIVVSIPEDDYNGNYYKFVSKIMKL